MYEYFIVFTKPWGAVLACDSDILCLLLHQFYLLTEIFLENTTVSQGTTEKKSYGTDNSIYAVDKLKIECLLFANAHKLTLI